MRVWRGMWGMWGNVTKAEARASACSGTTLPMPAQQRTDESDILRVSS